MISGLNSLELEAENDTNLTDDEKLLLISNISLTIEVLPETTDDVSEYLKSIDENINARGFFERVGNFIKKVVNGVATVVGSVINGIAMIDLAANVINGTIQGSGIYITAAGGFVGLIAGISAVFTQGRDGDYVCLLCIYERDNPCCCTNDSNPYCAIR